MRPLPGDDATKRPRSYDNESPSTLPFTQGHHHPGHQMTFALGNESTVDVALEHASALLQRPGEQRKRPSHDIFSDSSQASFNDKDNSQPKERSPRTRHDAVSIASRPESPVSLRAPASCSPSHVSQPVTPSLLGTSRPTSALSSISSRRGSFSGSLLEDLAGSQAFSVDNDSDNNNEGDPMMASGAAPQLIMPSIKMPSRRPFTDAGKAMGRLKVLIAGDSGIGKTSLIKAIVQSCNHIVHVDPIAPTPLHLQQLGSTSGPVRHGNKKRPNSKLEMGTAQITEVYASTKPYPEWWSELDDSRLLRRRKSIDEAVLDRNICFVDTPGYSSGPSAMETISNVVQYVESQFRRMSSNSLGDGETLNLLGGDGGVQVDVVFYMVSNRLRPVDIEYLRQLAPLTNVVILIAQADLLTPEQVSAAKKQIECQLQEVNIRSFCFDLSSSSPQSSSVSHAYAISSALGTDHESMDASLLMSPDYVQPLVSTELVHLINHVFCQDGISWLRHAAAKRYVQWRSMETPSASRPVALRNPMSKYGSRVSSYAQLQQGSPASQVLTPHLGATSSYALARVTDHTQREERLAEIRLANWASDLQKSLAKEREQFEKLARGERAVWLTERLNECVLDGTLVPIRARDVTLGRKRSGGVASQRSTVKQHQDPLGLLEVAADMRRKGIVVLEVLGSLGVIGGIALWLARNLPGHPWLPHLAEWERFWYGVR